VGARGQLWCSVNACAKKQACVSGVVHFSGKQKQSQTTDTYELQLLASVTSSCWLLACTCTCSFVVKFVVAICEKLMIVVSADVHDCGVLFTCHVLTVKQDITPGKYQSIQSHPVMTPSKKLLHVMNSLRYRHTSMLRAHVHSFGIRSNVRTRRLSASTADLTLPAPAPANLAPSPTVTKEVNTSVTKGCLGEIVRHGSGDACVTLNVGGKEFTTLRSTINANAVLAEHVARAEYNPTISTGSTTKRIAFIDRDPDHFNYILRHLRNRAEQSTARHFEKSSSLMKQKSTTQVYIDLPSDPTVLHELYVEAVYYRIPELQNALKKYSMTAHVSHLFMKQWNPFDFFTKLLLQLRVGALAAGTVGGTWYMGAKHDWDSTLRKWGWRS
jgi:BTB/POZ domain